MNSLPSFSVPVPNPDAARQALKPLRLDRPVPKYPPELRQLFAFYKLDIAGARHDCGTLKSGTFTLAVHVFQPQKGEKSPKKRGTVLIAHGYYDHTGVWRSVIPPLLQAGFTVVVYDQPGHGLSSGLRAAIKDFAAYRKALRTLRAFCHKKLPSPLHLLAHSMGAGVALDVLAHDQKKKTGGDGFSQVVLLAPLIHSDWWRLSGIGFHLIPGKIKSIPRKFRRNSSDQKFLAFCRRDPLQARTLPLCWVAAHRKWAKSMEQLPNCSRPLTILQGKKDSTVDWRYNLPFIQRKFSHAKCIFFPSGGHQLMNETPTIRQVVIATILHALTGIEPTMESGADRGEEKRP